MKIFRECAVVLTVGETPTNIAQISNLRLGPGLTKAVNRAASVDPRYVGGLESNGMIDFSTPALALALGVIGLDGGVLASMDVYIPQLANQGVREAGSAHVKITMTNALGIVRSLSARQGAEASGQFEAHSVWDGENDPWTVAADQALPDLTDYVPEKFTLGPWDLDTTEVDVGGVTVNTGITLEKRGSRGSYYPTFCGIAERNPTIVLEQPDVELLELLGIDGLSVDDVIGFFRAGTNRDGLAALTAASHIKLTAVDTFCEIQNVGVGSGRAADTPVLVTPVYDGTNAAVALALAQKIQAE